MQVSRSPLGLRELKHQKENKQATLFCRSPLGLRELKHILITILKFGKDCSPLGLRESTLFNCSGNDSDISLCLFGQKSIFIFGMGLVAQYSIIKY